MLGDRSDVQARSTWAVLDALPMAACVADTNHRVVHANTAWDALNIPLSVGGPLATGLAEATRIGHASCLLSDRGTILRLEVSRVEDSHLLVLVRPGADSTPSETGSVPIGGSALPEAVETGVDPVACVNAAGMISYANAAFVELMHLDTARRTEHSVREFIADSHQVIWDQALNRVGWAGTVRCLVVLRSDSRENGPVDLQLLSQRDGTCLVLAHHSSTATRPHPARATAALESQLREIVDRTAGVILRHDAAGVVLEANPAAAQALGYEAADLVGQSLMGLASPEDREDVRAYSTGVGEGECRRTLRFMACDGDERRWVCEGAPEIPGDSSASDAGTVTIQMHALDITPRVRMEAALRVAEERCHRSLDRASDSVWMFDTDGLCLYVNEGAAKLLQRERGEVVGLPFTDFVPGSEVNRAGRLLRSGLQSGGAAFLTRVQRADGEIVWLELNAVDLGDGTYQAIGRDMTAWLEAQESIRASEERYRGIVETAAEGILVLDAEGSCTFANRQMATMLGRRADELLGSAAGTFVHPGDSVSLLGL